MEGERAESLVRLGDAYSALAENPGKFRPGIFAPTEKYADPVCDKCEKKMKLMHSLPRTDIMPAMQAFWCDACGEMQIWKGEISSSGKPPTGTERSTRPETHYVAISFTQIGSKGLAPGVAIERSDAATAILRAELMARDMANAGSVAFSRRAKCRSRLVQRSGDPQGFGKVPKDFDIA